MSTGDAIILTKPLGTGVLFAANMRGAAAGAWVAHAVHGMTTSNEGAAQTLIRHGATSCTDVTGFGLLGHLFEMAKASRAHIDLNLSQVPLLPGAQHCVSSGIFSSLQPANLRLKRAVINEADRRMTCTHFSASGWMRRVCLSRLSTYLQLLNQRGIS